MEMEMEVTSSKYQSNQKKEWFLRVGEPYIRIQYGCYMKAMFITMSLLIERAWVHDGEQQLWSLFSESYIKNYPFKNWYFPCSR